MEDIAIVGIGLRFPGEATSPEELWNVLERGESQWSEFPEDRLNIEGYFHPSGDRQGSISFRGAHFLKGDIAAFDSPFFSIAAEDAKAIDPQQRMLLEVSYEALENAGIRKEDVDGSDTAVYVGSFVKDYEQICLRDPDWQPRYAATGNGIAIMANRISHFFNFHGPSMTIDTGCSGSLVSIHLAVQTLRNRESSLALAAGSGLILTPNTIMPMTALNFLSPDGKCFTFDERANGYGRGEGIGVVVMKRLSDALRDNDTIRAVIRGSSVNQDGRTPGITLPSKEAQVANIRLAYGNAGLSFDQTAYVECHGTGTQAGDWRELRAVSETLALDRERDRPVVVGSVKPNIGHLEGAAGVAGLIKGVLVLEHAKIPPNINFETGNSSIDFDDWKVTVPRTVMEWPMDGIRRVSVNCFGFGGTNAHVILDEAPAYLSERMLFGHHSSIDGPLSPTDLAPREGPRLFCYSSHEKGGILRNIESHLEFLETRGTAGSGTCLRDYSYTLGCRRSVMEWRGFVVADSLNDLASKARKMTVERSGRNQAPRIGFLFCGQGAQWAQMGIELLTFKVFRQSLKEAADYLADLVAVDVQEHLDLVMELLRTQDRSRIGQARLSQPATTAVQVALVDLLRSLGVEPSHMVGHSSGEIAAAYAAGALTRHQALKVAYYRGRAAASIRDKAPKLRGAMMVVGLSVDEVREHLAGQSVQVACINSPRSTTVSGRAEAVVTLERMLRVRGVFCRVLNVDIAYHSSQMKLVEHEYRDSLAGLRASQCKPSVRMVSSVSGDTMAGPELDGAYWATNMVSPVLYAAAVEAMMTADDGGPDMLIEISPRPTLRTPTLDVISALGRGQPAYRATLDPRMDGVLPLLELGGELWARGCAVDLEGLLLDGPEQNIAKCLSDLPPYRWDHGRTYWHESHLSLANRFRAFGRRDLIGAPTADSVPMEPRWRGFIRVSENPWIQDHQVQKTIVYPAAGMVSMILEAASQMRPDVFGYELVKVRIDKAMVVPGSSHGLEVALNIKKEDDDDGPASFVIYSKPLDRDWEANASGGLYFRTRTDGWAPLFDAHDAQLETLDKTCDEQLDTHQLYEALDTVGINYGPLFRNMTEVRRGDGAVVSRVRVPDTQSKMPAKFEYPHLLHPATLDGMFQTLFAIDPRPMVPTFIRSIFVSAVPSASCFAGYAVARRAGVRGADATISMRSGEARVVVDGLRLTGLSSPSDGDFLPNHRGLCSEIVWDEEAASASPGRYAELVRLLAHKYPALTVLQCGGGVLLARETLTAVGGEDQTPRLARYTVVEQREEVVKGVLDLAEDMPARPLIDIQGGIEGLGDELYHLVVVFADAGVDASSLRKHVGKDGMLLSQALVPASKTNGNTDHGGVSNGQVVFDAVDGGPLNLDVYRHAETRTDSREVMILLPEGPSTEALAFIDMMDHLDGIVAETVTTAHIRDEPRLVTGKIVISLLDFSHKNEDEPCSVFAWSEVDFDDFGVLQSLARGIIWITRSANMRPVNPKGAPIVALARTLMSEDPLKVVVTLDVGIDSGLGDSSLGRNVIGILDRTWHRAAVDSPRETEYGSEGGRLFIPRLRPLESLNRQLLDGDEDHQGGRSLVRRQFSYDGTGLRLTLARPGIGDGAQRWAEFEPEVELGPDEVELEVTEAPLTHLDLDTVMGRSYESGLGMDAVGRVRRVGSRVQSLQVGHEVAAMTADGAVRNMLRADANLVMAKQDERPESLPSLLFAAYYGLVHVGRAGPGRTVLIQAGGSAHGLAAVAVARRTGARVLASVFGPDTAGQRERLRRSGLEDGSILNAEAGCLVGLVRAESGLLGVDVVFNPSGEHVDAGLQCVRRGGIVVQFTDKSPSPRALPTIEGPVTVVSLDIGQIVREDASLVGEVLGRAVRMMQRPRGGTKEMMDESWGIDGISHALRRLQMAPYTGLVRLVLNDSQVEAISKGKTTTTTTTTTTTAAAAAAAAAATATTTTTTTTTATPATPAADLVSTAVDPDATYLLAGGLGGLGRSIADLLVAGGARHLAFLSRSGPASASVRTWFDGLRTRGVDARELRADICDADSLSIALRAVDHHMPAVCTIFHCAAVIRDAVFDNMNYTDWRAASDPKTRGSLNLSRAMPHQQHVFLSSAASVIGSRGQANYAAANCFQDALARSLRRAVAVDLGPVLGAGMLAGGGSEAEATLASLRASGFYAIRHADFLTIVAWAFLGRTPAQMVVGVGTGGLMRQNRPADPYWSRTAMYQHLNLVDLPASDLVPPSASQTCPTATPSQTPTNLTTRCPDVASATQLVSSSLINMLAQAMTMLPEELDAGRPPSAYGVDSLVAVGVRSFLLACFAVEVSVFEVLGGMTIDELAGGVAERAFAR
ncbi:polyketide synthase [Ophiocordyceps camponoti-floridani]|uniref:Polyketide synthase n=1 Tax=Ophiocordyceps camponoti-floridani TaxID=2030778 RepID=A0A8H4QCZ5_9HYPO|nr:polyketide synthase [Ophiocordyceps camponoti-floridani]